MIGRGRKNVSQETFNIFRFLNQISSMKVLIFLYISFFDIAHVKVFFWFQVFSLNLGKYGPDITSYLDTSYSGIYLNSVLSVSVFSMSCAPHIDIF